MPDPQPSPHADPPASRPRLHLLRALSSRNYRLFFIGQGISLIGTWLTRLATSWLVYRLTGSSLLLGVVGFAGQVPTLLFAPYAGVIVERSNRHRVMVVTQVLAMAQSLVMAALTISHVVQVWHILALSIFQGVINAFDTPARQAFLVEMVSDRRDLPNAIALNSSMVNATRLLGPAIGGLLIAATGEGACFLIDGLSYIAVVASLLMMRVAPRPPAGPRGPVLEEMREGFRYAFGFAPIRRILSLLAIVSLAGVPYMVLMPVVATKVLHGGPHTLGFLMGASGVGALIAALNLASRRTVLGLGGQRILAAGVFGAALIAFSCSTTTWLSMLLLLVAGGAMMFTMAASNTILQTIVDEDKRGRVMSIFTMAFFGSVPFGSLIAGALADRVGAMPTIALGGATCVAASIYFAFGIRESRELVRPIYRRLGILPELASGVANATELNRAEGE